MKKTISTTVILALWTIFLKGQPFGSYRSRKYGKTVSQCIYALKWKNHESCTDSTILYKQKGDIFTFDTFLSCYPTESQNKPHF